MTEISRGKVRGGGTGWARDRDGEPDRFIRPGQAAGPSEDAPADGPPPACRQPTVLNFAPTASMTDTSGQLGPQEAGTHSPGQAWLNHCSTELTAVNFEQLKWRLHRYLP